MSKRIGFDTESFLHYLLNFMSATLNMFRVETGET